jgi:L-aspartate oxidase
MPSILIIGGGLAGLFTALKLAPHPCTVLTPAPLGEGASSAWAQGGIAAAIGEGDSIESHVADTLAAGAGLCDAAMVRLMASEASDRIIDLLEYGVPFDRDLQGKLVQSREAAHSAHRIVRVRGDMAGKAIMEALVAAVRKTPSIRVIEGAEAFALIQEPEGTIAGAAMRLSSRSEPTDVLDVRADVTVLATGGIGQLYAVTTNPKEACGRGLLMAATAGARCMNLEFVQFHPTAIDIGRDPAPLATEALRGEGAILINARGERFMTALHPDAELAPRDIVARGVFAELTAGRRPMLDATRAVGSAFPEKFPGVYATCISAGIDPVIQPIPVAPAEHYHMGGVATDANGATSLPGLYAVGEVAYTGVHGANRLASNSLLEAVVFGARVARHVLELPHPAANVRTGSATEALKEPNSSAALVELRQIVSRHLGVVRNAEGLREALNVLSGMRRRPSEISRHVRDMATLGAMIAHSALHRQESRGGHYRSDYPEADPLSRPHVAATPGELLSAFLNGEG